MAAWPYQPVVALERLEEAAYVWDDADTDVTWDDTTPERVWDAPGIGSGFIDALCDLISLEIDPGEPDELGLFPAVETTVTLANPGGAYTVWTADGRLAYWAPGRELCIWAHRHDDDSPWWLFRGRVASWVEDPAAGTVTIVAHDGTAQLAEDMAGTWTPGTAGQLPRARIQAIATQTGYTDPIGGDLGDVALATVATDATPIDAAHRAALSDGGIIVGDADGTLIYRNRLWRTGRSDQTRTVAFSDNRCTVDAVVWEPEYGPDDLGLATRVELVNTAGLTATAVAPAGPVGRRYRLTHPDPDLWTTQPQGDTLAGYLLAQTANPTMAARSWALHLHTPSQDLWSIGIDLRRGDLVRWVHDFTDAAGQPATLDVHLVAWGARHEITPETWTVTVGGTRTVDYTRLEMWDRTLYVWDDPSPFAVWRY